jgi:hypothetical protein
MRCSRLPFSGSKSCSALPLQSVSMNRQVAVPPAVKGRGIGRNVTPASSERRPSAPGIAATIGAPPWPPSLIAPAPKPASAAATARQSWNGGVASVAAPTPAAAPPARASVAANAARREAVEESMAEGSPRACPPTSGAHP